MKKASLILAISASFIVGTLVAGNLVFAAPADSQNELLSAILQEVEALNLAVQTMGSEKQIQLVPVSGEKLELIDQGTSFLFYGDTLCHIQFIGSFVPKIIYIEFGSETTVKHQAPDSCGGFGDPGTEKINLQGGADLVFQPGDFLILQEAAGWNERYKQQTIP